MLESFLKRREFMKQIFNKSEYKKYLKNIDVSKYFNDKEIDYSIIINYLKYNCKNNTFKGIEKVATILNCSSRQLQRVLNKLETENIVRKVGKGSYKLLEFNEV